MEEKENLFRVNARIGKKQNEWLDKESKETGISKSGLIQLAIETYINQKEVVQAMNNMQAMVQQLAEIQNLVNEQQQQEQKKIEGTD